MKVAITVFEDYRDCVTGKRSLAFKTLEEKEAMTFINDAVTDGLVVFCARWDEDFVPNQWDDRAVNYRV